MIEYAIIWLATLLIADALRPKLDTKDPELVNAGEVGVPTSEEGRAVPLCFGTVETAGVNVLDAWGLRINRQYESVADGLFSSQDVFKYDEFYLNMDIGVCQGWTDYDNNGGSALLDIKLNDTSIYAQNGHLVGTYTDGEHRFVNNRELWGSESAGGVVGGYRTFNGHPSQLVDTNLLAARGLDSACRGVYRIVFGYQTNLSAQLLNPLFPANIILSQTSEFLWGHSENISSPTIRIRRTPKPWSTGMTSGYHSISGGANPAVVIYLLLTLYSSDTVKESKIDVASFKHAANLFHAEGTGVNMTIDGTRTVADAIKELEQITESRLMLDESTGLYKLVCLRSTDSTSLSISPSEIVAVESFGKPSKSEIINRVRLTYTSTDTTADRFSDKTVVVSTAADGAENTFDFNAKSLGTEQAALLVANRMLRSNGNPLPRASITVNHPSAASLSIGSKVFVDFGSILPNQAALTMRVTKVVKPSLASLATQLELVGDSYGHTTQVAGGTTSNSWSTQAALSSVLAIACPAELNQTTPAIAMPVRANSTTLATIATASNTSSGSFFCNETLLAPMSRASTTAQVSTTSVDINNLVLSSQAMLSKQQWLIIYSANFSLIEIVAFEAVSVSGSTFTITGIERAQLGTTAQDIPAGSKIVIIASRAPLKTDSTSSYYTPVNRSGVPGQQILSTSIAWNEPSVYPPAAVSITGAGVITFNGRLKSTCVASSTLVAASAQTQAGSETVSVSLSSGTTTATADGVVSGSTLNLSAFSSGSTITANVRHVVGGVSSNPVQLTFTKV